MPKGRFAALTSWSFSVYTQYVKCPFSVCLDKIQRIRRDEPENAALMKGNRSHEITDVYIGGVGPKRPDLVQELVIPGRPGVPEQKVQVDVTPIKADLVRLRKAKARTEQLWAFDRQWNQVDWKDWDRAWLRVKTDVCADTLDPPTVEIIDWKSGRVYPDHKQQRSLYALGGLQLVQLGGLAGGSKDTELTAKHIYIDTGQTATEKFTMKNLAALKREWTARIKEMMSDTTYRARTGSHCRWCKYRKSAGGPCPEDM